MVDRRFSGTYLRHIDNSHIEEENVERTEQLCSKVKLLKHFSILIHEETKCQDEDLKKYGDLMDMTKGLVGRSRRRVILISESSNWKIYLYLLLFSFFIFLVIYFLIKR